MEKIHTSERLKQIMKERNLRQIDIVKMARPLCEQYKVRLEKNDISQYVSGKSEPGQYKLFILAKTLNVQEAWLMGLDAPMERNYNIEPKRAPNITEDCITPLVLDKANSIFTKYSHLNNAGKEKAENYIDDLLDNPKYTSSSNEINIERNPVTASIHDSLEIAAYGGKGNQSPKRKKREIT